jgi:hypothetical protein
MEEDDPLQPHKRNDGMGVYGLRVTVPEPDEPATFDVNVKNTWHPPMRRWQTRHTFTRQRQNAIGTKKQ